MSEYKDGRGDYYLAEGKREDRIKLAERAAISEARREAFDAWRGAVIKYARILLSPDRVRKHDESDERSNSMWFCAPQSEMEQAFYDAVGFVPISSSLAWPSDLDGENLRQTLVPLVHEWFENGYENGNLDATVLSERIIDKLAND